VSAAEDEASRFDVASADETSLAVWVTGDGPPLVLVHGSLCDHTRFDPLVAELRAGMTTFVMDRRGFGASGDAAAYSIERELEDVAAVVDAVAARTDGPVALWGHSYCSNCAMGGAAFTSSVRHLLRSRSPKAMATSPSRPIQPWSPPSLRSSSLRSAVHRERSAASENHARIGC
jgi:pimeloyl-ACP methyl ester carboxylesterase